MTVMYILMTVIMYIVKRICRHILRDSGQVGLTRLTWAIRCDHLKSSVAEYAVQRRTQTTDPWANCSRSGPTIPEYGERGRYRRVDARPAPHARRALSPVCQQEG